MIQARPAPSVDPMGMLLILVSNRAALPLGVESARRLAQLGVTRVAVLQDEGGLALAIEGWAFDPARSAHLALEVLAPSAREVRTLHQVAEVGVPASATDGHDSSEKDAALSEIDSELSRKGGSK
jgi:hypothetical protein